MQKEHKQIKQHLPQRVNIQQLVGVDLCPYPSSRINHILPTSSIPSSFHPLLPLLPLSTLSKPYTAEAPLHTPCSMASSTEDQVGPLGPETWYKSLHPLSVDLVGDFAGKELFAIHGDALMLYCITKAKVDLDSKCSSARLV